MSNTHTCTDPATCCRHSDDVHAAAKCQNAKCCFEEIKSCDVVSYRHKNAETSYFHSSEKKLSMKVRVPSDYGFTLKFFHEKKQMIENGPVDKERTDWIERHLFWLC